MTTLPFTARVCKSGKGFVLWIPKAVSSALKLKDKNLVVIQISKTGKAIKLPFTARVCKSGKGFVLWIPKAISSGLKLNDKSIAVVQVEKR